MRRNITLSLLAVTLLASCGTPQERCISRNTDEYRNVSRLLAQVEGNLARGYAWEERTVIRTDLDYCPTVMRNNKGERIMTYRTCFRDVADTERYRVAIDPQVETRKRDNLVQRRAALAKQAAAVVNACKTSYPE